MRNTTENFKKEQEMIFPTAEDVWSEIEDEVRKNLEREVKPILEKEYTEEFDGSPQEEMERVFLQEKGFVEKVWGAFEDLVSKENQKDIAFLFDIDETIVTVDLSYEEGKTIIRPACLKILDRLSYISSENDIHIDIGFLTTRGGDAVKQQLNDPNSLLPVAAHINKDFIYSTHNLYPKQEERETPEYERKLQLAKLADGDWDKEKEFLLALGSSIDPEFPSEMKMDGKRIFLKSGDMKKLALLDGAIAQHPEKSFIVVDDFEYPKILQASEKLRGVYLSPKEKFYL